MKRPLITGASISADYASPSPGKRLALRYTTVENIRTIAVGGQPGAETVALLTDKDLADRTIVIAVDAFFWDSTLPSSTKSIEALRGLVKRTEQLKIPLVLGNIPELLRGRQPGRKALNDEIARICKASEGCYYMPFDELFTQVMHDRYLEIKGTKYSLKQLIPDGLHINDLAGEYLADRLKGLLVP